MSYPTPETDVDRPIVTCYHSQTGKKSYRLGSKSLCRQDCYCSLGGISYVNSNAGGRLQYPESVASAYVTISEISDVYPFR